MNANPELVLPRGQFAGRTIEEVPSPYLRRLVIGWKDEEVVVAAEAELRWRTRYCAHFEDLARFQSPSH